MSRIILLTIFLGFGTSSYAQDTLLLFHPTAYNIDVIKNLVDKGMLDLDGYHVLGVYHANEIYDYGKTEEAIQVNQYKRFSIRRLSGELVAENLFEENDCSKEFITLFEGSRGALFLGGPDIPPSIYGESVHLLTRVTDPFRHYMEISYLFHLLGGNQDPLWDPLMKKDKRYLVNGICLGMQSMNVATGGTMIQDIPTEVFSIWNAEEVLALPPDQMHRNYNDMVPSTCEDHTSYHFHQVNINKGSSSPLVLSSHHQALQDMGLGWTVSATSTDGRIIEAIQHEDYTNVTGVQFHPEKPGLFDPSITHRQSCGSMINFSEIIADTDSYDFHIAYWRSIGKTLQKNRNK
jgi:putative glutamine amidotransferase